MSAEIVALLVLLAGVVGAVVFTLVVVVVDRSGANTRQPDEDDGARERESEER